MAGKIDRWDKRSANRIAEALVGALQDFGQAEGLEIMRGNGRFDDGEFTLQVKLRLVREDGSVYDPLEAEFKRSAFIIGLKPEHLHCRFQSNGHEFRVAGLKLANRKFPVIAERLDNGKRYKFAEEKVRRLLGA